MNALFIASLAGMVGIFFMRYDLVIVGQLVPAFHGMGLVDYPDLYTYMPSLHENLVVLGGIAFCGLTFLWVKSCFGDMSPSIINQWHNRKFLSRCEV